MNTKSTNCLQPVVAGGVRCVETARFFSGQVLSGAEALVSGPADVRSASGWLSGRRPLAVFAASLRSLGTGVAAEIRKVLRSAPGWLAGRHTPGVLPVGPAASGTARLATHFSKPMEQGDYHVSVLPSETCEWMNAGPESFIIDGTLGGGGHSELFLEAGAEVLGVDRDPEALAFAEKRLAVYGERFGTWQGNFSTIPQHPKIVAGRRSDGLLLDLGVSSRQLDEPSRGFSFQKEGPLDMRMGPGSRWSAADIVNEWTEEELRRTFFEYGEEPKSRRIAAAIVKRRADKQFETTLDLASLIESTVGRRGRTHPATRVFQAIRMAANEELESLRETLASVPRILKPGGTLLVITFHSLEDRLVKHWLRQHSAPFIDDPGWPEPKPNPDQCFELLRRKAIAPTSEEISRNPRARSAKLRVARLLAPAS